jgi:hypothetical protein
MNDFDEILFIIFFGLTTIIFIPIAFFIIAGYNKKDRKKAILYAIGFYIFISTGVLLINISGIWLAMFTPILFLIFILVKWLMNENAK